LMVGRSNAETQKTLHRAGFLALRGRTRFHAIQQ
jgi:hypothetical protein